jgi:MFS family permease
MVNSIPRGVWILGFVSLLMDISSEMIHALLPVFVVATLGASTVTLGFIEGFAEAVAQVMKLFSGVLSDRWRSRKSLALLGYGLAAAVKPLFPLATSVGAVFFARAADRIGKGIRGAPRDALVADLTPPELRGAAFGLRQSLDTVGAVTGPLVAVVLMGLFFVELRHVLWIACLPAVLAVALLFLGVREPAAVHEHEARPAFDTATLGMLGQPFWRVCGVGALLSLARFSEAFLILRASSAGLSVTYVPLVLVVMNIVYTFSAYPAGALSDRVGRAGLLAASLVSLTVADLVLAAAPDATFLLIGVVLWGLHMGLSQGVLSAMVANVTPPTLRATGFGAFNLVGGAATLVSSVVAGALWEWSGEQFTFLAGAAFAVLALAAMGAVRPGPSN